MRSPRLDSRTSACSCFAAMGSNSHTSGVGDEGIDGIGTVPLSEVLSATVAVQAKRYDPTASQSVATPSLFQRDAAAVGAERAVFMTLASFTSAARKAATTVTPRVDLIDGERDPALSPSPQASVSRCNPSSTSPGSTTTSKVERVTSTARSPRCRRCTGRRSAAALTGTQASVRRASTRHDPFDGMVRGASPRIESDGSLRRQCGR